MRQCNYLVGLVFCCVHVALKVDKPLIQTWSQLVVYMYMSFQILIDISKFDISLTVIAGDKYGVPIYNHATTNLLQLNIS